MAAGEQRTSRWDRSGTAQSAGGRGPELGTPLTLPVTTASLVPLQGERSRWVGRWRGSSKGTADTAGLSVSHGDCRHRQEPRTRDLEIAGLLGECWRPQISTEALGCPAF